MRRIGIALILFLATGTAAAQSPGTTSAPFLDALKTFQQAREGETSKIDPGDPNDPINGRKVLANNRRIEVNYIRTSSKATASPSPNTANRENNYSKWKVNQEIFNFFLCRKQFCSRIEDFQDLGNYTTPNMPEPLDIVGQDLLTPKKPSYLMKDNNMQQYGEAVQQAPFMVGRYDDITDNQA